MSIFNTLARRNIWLNVKKTFSSEILYNDSTIDAAIIEDMEIMSEYQDRFEGVKRVILIQIEDDDQVIEIDRDKVVINSEEWLVKEIKFRNSGIICLVLGLYDLNNTLGFTRI
jgi:hypothetical protein